MMKVNTKSLDYSSCNSLSSLLTTIGFRLYRDSETYYLSASYSYWRLTH